MTLKEAIDIFGRCPIDYSKMTREQKYIMMDAVSKVYTAAQEYLEIENKYARIPVISFKKPEEQP